MCNILPKLKKKGGGAKPIVIFHHYILIYVAEKNGQAAINKQKPPLSGGYKIEQNAQTTRPLTSCQYWFELPSGPFLIVRESFPFYLQKISSLFPGSVFHHY